MAIPHSETPVVDRPLVYEPDGNVLFSTRRHRPPFVAAKSAIVEPANNMDPPDWPPIDYTDADVPEYDPEQDAEAAEQCRLSHELTAAL